MNADVFHVTERRRLRQSAVGEPAIGQQHQIGMRGKMVPRHEECGPDVLQQRQRLEVIAEVVAIVAEHTERG